MRDEHGWFVAGVSGNPARWPRPRGWATLILSLFSGGGALIQPCSQVGDDPDSSLFSGCGDPDPALFNDLVTIQARGTVRHAQTADTHDHAA